MTIDAARFQKLLNDFKLEQLFNELGWDNASLKPQVIPVSGETFTLTAIAQKRGVAVLHCTPDAAGNIPPRPTLLKIEKEAAKLAHEHLLVFADAAQTTLTWMHSRPYVTKLWPIPKRFVLKTFRNRSTRKSQTWLNWHVPL